MRVYVAASFGAIDDAAHVARRIQDEGHTVTSSWLGGGGRPEKIDDWPIVAADWARKCDADVRSSDVVLVLHPSMSTTGGLMWEFGLAVGLGLPVVVVGAPTSIFCFLVPVVPGVDAALDLLAGMQERSPRLHEQA